MSARQLMPDERRDPDARLFRELYDRLDDLGGHVEKLATRMDAVSALVERVEQCRDEIGRLREREQDVHERITVIETRHKLQQEASESGVLRVRPGVVAAVVSVLIALATALVKAYEFVRGRL